MKKNVVGQLPYELIVKNFMNQSDSLLKDKKSKLFEGNVFEERKSFTEFIRKSSDGNQPFE